jgi:hypothetical protein
MTSPIEVKIFGDFTAALEADTAVTENLQAEIITLLQNEKLPSAEAVMETIKQESGDSII